MPHKGLKIIRPLTKLQKGIKARACDFIVLHTNLYGRIGILSTRRQDSFEEVQAQGLAKEGIRKVVILGKSPLCKVMSSDLLCIPWGNRPNTWCSPNLPYGLSDVVVINTPDGQEKLVWNGTDAYVGPTLTLTWIDEEQWCLSGAMNYCFPNDNQSFCCQKFPEGYSFIKMSGPTAYFEIQRVDEHIDDKGRIAFYTLEVESLKSKGHYIQE